MENNINTCINCGLTFVVKYKSVDWMFSTDFCPRCNSNMSKTIMLNSVLNSIVVADYIYSVMMNQYFGKDTVELPNLVNHPSAKD